MYSPKSFAIDISGFVEETERRLDLIMQKTCQKIGKRLVNITPIDTGRSKSSWRVTFNNESDLSVTPDSVLGTWEGDIDVVERIALEQINEKLKMVVAGDLVRFSNNVEYIMILEKGRHVGEGGVERGSHQAPSGMVGVSMILFEEFVKESVQEVRSI